MSQRPRGFTLIELAVALFIITLVLGSLLVPLGTQVQQRQISDTQKTLDEIRDALIGFAVTWGYLPCPDTDNDGNENVASGICTGAVSNIAVGNLPWQTLGLAASTDLWGNRFRYVIREEYGRRSPSTPFTLSTTSANIRVCSTAATCTSAPLTSSAVVAVLSYGTNSYGATNSGGVTNSCPSGGCSADEQENIDTDRNIVSRVRSAAGATAGEFDDIVTWLPLYTLFNRMVAAGKLP